MCTNNILAFAFSILPITVVSQAAFFHLKRESTQDKMLILNEWSFSPHKRAVFFLELVTGQHREHKISAFSTTYLVLIPDLPACCLLSEKKLSLYCYPVWKQLGTHFNHHHLLLTRTFFRN